MRKPITVEMARSFPEAKMLDPRYPFMGSEGILGDDVFVFSQGDSAYRIECLRETMDGPDVWVKIRL